MPDEINAPINTPDVESSKALKSETSSASSSTWTETSTLQVPAPTTSPKLLSPAAATSIASSPKTFSSATSKTKSILPSFSLSKGDVPTENSKSTRGTLSKSLAAALSKKSTAELSLDDKKSEESEKKLSQPEGAFDDLVLYNDRGEPYIDVNRLIYNPRSKEKKEVKEKFSWYFADHMFILSNFFSLICSGYLLAVAISLIFWQPSIDSVIAYSEINKKLKGFIFSTKIFGVVLTPRSIGFVLLGVAVTNGVNVVVGTLSCMYGIKFLLFQHVGLDLTILGVQVAVALSVSLSGTCDSNHILAFQEGMERFIVLYANTTNSNSSDPTDIELRDERHYASMALNEIQLSMQCCGASNWTDYINSRIVEIPMGDNRVLPSSCCRAWWIRNIHCAEGVHMWAAPFAGEVNALKFRQRIHQIGCASRVWLGCKKMLFMSGQGLLFNGIINFILISLESFSVALQIRTLDTIVREMKALEDPKTKGRAHREEGEEADEDEEDDMSKLSSKRQSVSHGIKAINELKSMLALPTEDEIQFIKSRTAFAKFEVQMKRTNVGKMLKTARSAAIIPVSDDETLIEQLSSQKDDKRHRHHTKPHKTMRAGDHDRENDGLWHPRSRSVGAIPHRGDLNKEKEKVRLAALALKAQREKEELEAIKAKALAERKPISLRPKRKKPHKPPPKYIETVINYDNYEYKVPKHMHLGVPSHILITKKKRRKKRKNNHPNDNQNEEDMYSDEESDEEEKKHAEDAQLKLKKELKKHKKLHRKVAKKHADENDEDDEDNDHEGSDDEDSEKSDKGIKKIGLLKAAPRGVTKTKGTKLKKANSK